MLVKLPPQAANPLAPVKPDQAKRTALLNEFFSQYARDHPDNVAVANLADIVCPGGAPCPKKVDGIVLRPKDGNHFEPDGAAWVAPRLIDELFTSLRRLDARRATTSTSAPR